MKFSFFDRFTSGLLVGSLFSIALAALFDSEVAQRAQDSWVNLATIFGAIIAALLALYGVNKQIAHQNDSLNKQITHQNSLEEKRRQASLNAAKSSLPLALSRLTDICETAIYFHLNQTTAGNFKTTDLDLAESTLEIFKECIEHSEGLSQRWLIAILARYQIMHSRSTGDIQQWEHARTDVYLAVDWVFLKSIVGHCFRGARLKGLDISRTVNLQNTQLPIKNNPHHEVLEKFNLLLQQRIKKLTGDISEFENGQVRTATKDIP